MCPEMWSDLRSSGHGSDVVWFGRLRVESDSGPPRAHGWIGTMAMSPKGVVRRCDGGKANAVVTH